MKDPIFLTMTLAQPAEATTDRQIRGVLLDTAEVADHTSAGRVRFLPDSLIAPGGDITMSKIWLEHEPGTSCGHLTSLAMDGTRYLAEATLATTPLGDDALTGITQRTRDGLSVGVEIRAGAWTEDGQTYEVSQAILRHVALCEVPAFTSAKIIHATTTRQETQMTLPAAPSTQPPAPQQLAAAQPPAQTPIHAAPRQADPSTLTLSGLASQIATMAAQGKPASVINAALSDITSVNDPGKGFLTPSLSRELWTMTPQRTVYSDHVATRAQLESAIQQVGWAWELPPKVSAYAGKKTEIPTNSPKTKLITADTLRYAGGWDVDRIYVDMANGQMVSSMITMATNDCKLYLEGQLAAALLPTTASTAMPKKSTLQAAISAAGIKAIGQGSVIDYIAISSDLWETLAAMREADKPWFYSDGTEGLAMLTGSGTLGGVPMWVDPSLPTATYLMGDKRACTLWLDPASPVIVQAVDLPRGGIDIGVFGYFALAVTEPRAVLKGTVGA